MSHVFWSIRRWCSPAIARALVHRLADVGAVVQHPVEEVLAHGVAARRPDPALRHLPRQFRGGADFEEAGEDPADVPRFLLVDHQLPVLRLVAVGRGAAHEDALHAAGPDLVADALRRHLALELGEGQQDVEGQAPHGGGGVEALGDADEGDVVAVEHLDQLREVHQRARQAVDLVDHHHVDQSVLDVGQQPLQGRAVQRAAGDAAVVILVADQHPAFRALAGDIGLAGLALGVEAVELLLEAFLGGFAGVDGAAELAGGRLGHARLPDS